MSTLIVPNVHFEATGNARAEYSTGNNVTFYANSYIFDNVSFSTLPSGSTVNVGFSQQLNVFTANSTWTKPANTLYITVTLIGGGGGGGGAAANTTRHYTAGGGGAGGTSVKTIMAADLRAAEPVTVGLGGAGGSSTQANGATGSNSVFGNSTSTFSNVVANGGEGGKGANVTVLGLLGGNGGFGLNGDFSLYGSDGFCGSSPGNTAAATLAAGGGMGGASYMSGSARRGTTGLLYGGGGGGANAASTTGVNGATGGNGVVIIQTFRNTA